MPHSPHTANEIRAMAPKTSQQSKANRNSGTKRATFILLPMLEMGELGSCLDEQRKTLYFWG
jgi:hypothetical protein